MSISSFIQKHTRELAPSYFALVMSTGIVSIAFSLFKFSAVSEAMFWLNNVEYIVLILLLISRLIFFFPQFAADFSAHKKGPGFFTLVASTNILGVQYVLLKQLITPAIILWIISLILWLVIMYAFLITIITKKQDPPLAEGINGAWLLLVVSTQSVSVLGSFVSPALAIPADVTIFIATSFFVLGIMLYIILITIMFYRLTFFPIDPQQFNPPFWIMTGAVAITTLAGATLVQHLTSTALYEIRPFIKGLTLLAWSTASFFLPLLLLLEVWRHAIKKVQLKYQPEYWSMVFSLGMYTVCSFRLSEMLGLDFLKTVPECFIVVAAAAWVLVFVGMLISTGKAFFSETKPKNE